MVITLDDYTASELRRRHSRVLGYDPSARSAATNLYSEATARGSWLRFWKGLRGRDYRLRSLDEVDGAMIVGQRALAGVQSVSLDSIVGSDGRPMDFDREFYPRRTHTRERWLSVADLWYRGIELPPVSLVQVGDEYFVLDGHHRVSVARAFGATAITAHVTAWLLAKAPVEAAALVSEQPAMALASGVACSQELSHATR